MPTLRRGGRADTRPRAEDPRSLCSLPRSPAPCQAGFSDVGTGLSQAAPAATGSDLAGGKRAAAQSCLTLRAAGHEKGKETRLPRTQQVPSPGCQKPLLTTARGLCRRPILQVGKLRLPAVPRAAGDPSQPQPAPHPSPSWIWLPDSAAWWPERKPEAGGKPPAGTPPRGSFQPLSTSWPRADVMPVIVTQRELQGCVWPKAPLFPCGHTSCTVTRFQNNWFAFFSH